MMYEATVAIHEERAISCGGQNVATSGAPQQIIAKLFPHHISSGTAKLYSVYITAYNVQRSPYTM